MHLFIPFLIRQGYTDANSVTLLAKSRLNEAAPH